METPKKEWNADRDGPLLDPKNSEAVVT